MKKFYTIVLILTAILCGYSNSVWGDEHLVADGATTSSYVPFYGYYGDWYERIQVVYPSSLLEDIVGAEITGMTFYLSSSAASAWTAQCSISLAESSASTIASSSAWNTGTGTTTVYSGTLNGTGSTMAVVFNTGNAFVYLGGDLLFELTTPTKGTNYPAASFYGITSTNAAMYGYNSSSLASVTKNRTSFIPKTTFTYEAAASTCPKPTLTLDDKDDESASFSWTAGGTETQWQYLYLPSATALTDSHWDDATLTSSTSATISGLSSNTSYTFYLRAYCAADDQSKPVKNTFTTACKVINTLPWNSDEDLASGTYMGGIDCWGRASTNTSYYSGYYVTNTTPKRWYFYGNNGKLDAQKNHKAIIVLPKFTTDIQQLKVKVKYSTSGTAAKYPQFHIGYVEAKDIDDISTFNDASKFVLLTSLAKTSSTSTYTTSSAYAMSSAPKGAYIAIAYHNNTTTNNSESNDYTGYIEQIIVESAQDCSKPTVSSVTQLSSTEARATWGAKTGVPTYQYCVVAHGAAADWSGNLTVGTNTVDISGLTAGTSYDFYVKCVCGGAASDPYEFSLTDCPSVSTVTLSNKTYNSVRVNWTTSSATNCDVRYKAGTGGWTTKETNTSATTTTITGLTVGTTYTIQVKPNCGGDGAWVAAETYTPTCPTPGALTKSNQTYNSVRVSWSAVAGVSTYNLRYKAAGDVVWTTRSSVTSPQDISGLTAGTTYTIGVQTECEGSWSETTYTPTYTAPSQPSAGSLTETTARITWSAVSDATGYQYILVAANAAADWTSPTAATSPLDLSGLTPGTSYDVYVRSVYPTGYSAASTKRNFTTTTVAPTITGASPTELTSSSATFAWTKNGYTTGVKYQWKIGSGSWSEPISGTSVNVTGLSASTNYTFYVRTYYSASVQSTAASKAFKTDCGAMTIPWEYNFNSESYGTGYPECWSILRSDYSSTNASYPSFTYSSGVDNTRCFSVYGGSSYGYMYVVLPQFEMSLNNLLLSFYYKHKGSSYLTADDPQFTVGYFSTPGNTATFVTLEDGALTRVASFTKAEFNLAPLSADVKNIVIRYGGYSYSAEAYLDDFSMTLAPECSKPATPTCTATTSTTATLTWTDYKAMSAWKIEYSENEDFSAPSTVVNADTKPFTLTGLTPNTYYYARVKSVCGAEDESDWSVLSAEFRTDCGEILSDNLPWSYGFETNTSTGSGNIPQCWKSISVDINDYWGEPYTYPYVYDVSARTGSNLLYFYGGVKGSTEEYAILPEFEDYVKDLTLEFYHKESYNDATHAQFTVGYLTDVTDSTTFHPVQAIARNTSYTQAIVPLSAFPASATNIAIRFGGATALTYGYIDDVKVYPTAPVFLDKTGDGLWKTAGNWMMGATPTIDDDAIIRKPVTIDANTQALAKSVFVDQINTRTGEIAIEATGELVIKDTLRKVTGTVRSKTFSPTTENDLYIGSTTSGNGGLVIGTHNGTNKATIDFYTKSYGKKEQNTSVAQYVGTPYNDETNILYNW